MALGVGVGAGHRSSRSEAVSCYIARSSTSTALIMDSGWIVAGTSIATIVATGFFSLRAKRIDAEQKLNEHKMSIRNTFVTKRIQAGEAFIGKNSLGITLLLVTIRFYEQMRVVRKPFSELMEIIKQFAEKEASLALDGNDVTELYFDVENHIAQFTVFYNVSNNITDELLNLFEDCDPNTTIEEIDSKIDRLIQSLRDMLNTRRELSKYLRAELGKYDIL